MRTPLYEQHVACGAKTVDFGGWEMPLHYGSQLDEHRAVRTDAGMFDVSHMRAVDLRGPEVRPLLRYLVANDVDKLAVSGKALYTCMLNGQGGVIDDLIVYYLGETWFRIVVNASTAQKDIEWIDRVRMERGFDVMVAPRRDLAMIAVQGPNARSRFWEALPAARGFSEPLQPFFCAVADDLLVARTGYTGEDGFEIMLPATDAPMLWQALQHAGVRPSGLGARDTLRLEAGLNLYGNDMDETVSPLDAGLAWTVDLRGTRDFVGRAALERDGKRHEFLGLKALEKGVMRAHQRVATHLGDGEITSGTYSPTLNASIGLARLPLGTKVGDAVEVDVRGKPLAAQVVKPPFVRNGRAFV
ncbi:MAG TPA: glycine cleavage system aminomethyltransferase GcvT [Burkholderiaceae bacterium]|nr:glycine cleavage system aminomethyltransferase GcvT [Burkholderiaceae bacterium]